MEYYSAIKNAFESVLMRWMKIEPIIHSDGEGNDIPLQLPGKSHGRRSLVGFPPPVTGSQSRKGAIAAPERHYL